MSRTKPRQATRTTGKGQTGDQAHQLEALWDELLSRQAERVRSAYAKLSTEEQKTVHAHLERMAVEAGWQPEQRLSAEAALTALDHQEK